MTLRASFVFLLAACSTPSPVLDGGPLGGGGSGGGGAAVDPGAGGGIGGGFVSGGGPGGGGGGFFADGGACGTTPPLPEDQSAPIAPTSAPPPISGGTLAVAPDDALVIADPDRDQVYLVSPANAVRTVKLLAQDEPGRVALVGTTRAFVALRRAAAVAELDVALGTVVARHPVCAQPRGLAWVEAHSALAVACATGELTELTFENGAVAASVTTRPAEDLRDVVAVDGGLWLSTFRSAEVIVRSDDGGVAPRPGPMAVGSGGPMGIDGGLLFPDAGVPPAMVPRVAWRMVPTANGAVVAHQQAFARTISGFGCGGGLYGGFSNDGILTSVLTRLTATGSVELARVRDAVLPVDVASNPAETVVVLASAAQGVWAKTPSTVGLAKVFGWSAPTLDQITAVGVRSTELVAFVRDPARLLRLSSGTKTGEVLGSQTLDLTTVRSTGHEIFHQVTNNKLACASCHPEGGEDGHVWKLPEGARRTPTLRGGLSGSEPFHWIGNLASMDKLLRDVMVGRMGGRPQSIARSMALVAWLDAQPKLGAPSGLDAAAVARGAMLFSAPALGCSSCHSGALGTNNANATVGTGLALQVPRLVDLAWRAPYFHDGRVPTLAARFTALGGGTAHGDVSQLTTEQVNDLVAYLRSR